MQITQNPPIFRQWQIADGNIFRLTPYEEHLASHIRVPWTGIDHVRSDIGDHEVQKLSRRQHGSSSGRNGCLTQLAAVVMDRPLARALRGNDSPVTTHAHGPHEQAKKKM